MQNQMDSSLKVKSKKEQKSETQGETGIVLKATKNVFIVLPIQIFRHYLQQAGFSEEDLLRQSIKCRLKGKRGAVEEEDLDYNNYLIAGDYVEYQVTDSRNGIILRRLPRESSIARVQRRKNQLLAVNIDLLVAVFSVKDPSFQPIFFDKILCLVALERLKLLVVFNKVDLFYDAKKEFDISALPSSLKTRTKIINQYMPEKVEMLYTSIQSGQGIDTLEQNLQGSTSVIVGQSGVGKSSLLNVLNTKLQRKTTGISYKYDFGKHTTSMPELCICKNYVIVDNPGVRDLIPVGLTPQDTVLAYPEFTEWNQQCKLPNCSHRIEPRCAVREKVGKQIEQERYQSYMKLRTEMEYIEKKRWYRKK